MIRHALVLSSMLTLSLAACRTDPDKVDTADLTEDCTWYEDADYDGFGDPDISAEGPCTGVGEGWADNDDDCDDRDAAINPDADEVCNAQDDDCDGEVDEDALDAVQLHVDADGDGFGDPENTVMACASEEGLVEDGTDCDDADPETFPGAPERCDGVDNDCDGEVDEELQEYWFADVDGDGFGDPDTTVESCDPGEGWVDNGDDCDDGDGAINPDAEEVCNELDDDCDGEVDEELLTTFWVDADNDGFGDPDQPADLCELVTGYADNDQDCDDNNSSISPDGTEVCNGLDDDCDGLIDDDDPEVTGTDSWYVDADGDGYGLDAYTTQACQQPSGYAALGGDCDDGDPAFNPGADEDDCADPNDYNCDGSTGYTDADADGWAACEDCNDADAAINPDATEQCNGVDDDCDGTVDEDDAVDAATWYADADGDGYGDAASVAAACDQPSGHVADDSDCDDSDAAVHPAAAESCNGVDDDCDGAVDEGVTSTFYADSDGDGFGDAASTIEACAASSGWVADDSDCDDSDAGVHPGADETCDGLDNDCDGSVDEAGAVDALTWYRDRDEDGYGDASTGTVACDQPSGYVADDLDCDDMNDAISPAADESCNGVDDDCDGTVDEDDAIDAATWFVDADGDSYGGAGLSVEACTQPSGFVADDSDCDDSDAAVNPAAAEICNEIDDDCDGYIDDQDPDVTGTSVWYVDYDGDGYGGLRLTRDACDQPPGYVADNTDCDDLDASANPGADEVCDGVDNDCDGAVDEPGALDEGTWYADADGDGFGDASISAVSCEPPSGFVADDTDCDDGAALVNPDAAEACNGVDDDCDGSTDEAGAVGESSWYADLDGDGYGDPAAGLASCDAPSGHVADSDDCDDTDAAINPGASEICNGVDDDCDGLTDDADGSVTGATTWYADFDGDGYGGSRFTRSACVQPSGYVATTGDCDDGAAAVNPGASEICNGVDDDCDGLTDDADGSVTGTATWYADADGDSYGDAGTSTVTCSGPSGYVLDASDCDDGDAAVNPGASEVCNGVDDDCDATVDEDDAVDASTWYADADGDSYGDPGTGTISCAAPAGTVSDGSDCDDTDAAINPGASEICNGVDDDCDGLTDDADGSVTGATTWYADFDGDGYGGSRFTRSACVQPSGYVATTGDCDDGAAAVNPGASEICNGVDDDCDGLTDDADGSVTGTATWYADADGDSYGDAGTSTVTCSGPSGYVLDASDCDDGDAAVNPGASEVCNGVDDDCDATVDEDDAVDASTWYADADGDSYGDPGTGTISCAAPAGTVSDGSDCDDTDAAINPGASEICNGVDDDCDGLTDDADGSVTGATTWYADYDSDGYGGSRFTRSACVQPSGYVATTGDCDDGDASAYPGAGEYCDGVDNDCDGSVDEAGALDESAWYADTDGDGYGDAASTQYACSQPSGYVSDSSDCDDGDGSVSPGAAELCNGADDDCDGTIDEDDAVDAATWYADVDGDGYGDPDAGTISCAQPAGTLADDSDCDDGDASINPAAAEVCDYVDNNCDGSDDEGYLVGSKYVLDSDCGSCGNDCSTYDYDNATASCDTAPSVPWCNFACDAGWYDADGETYNGCECLFISAIDDPFDGVDADCDGSDGDPSLAVFVSVDTGSTSGDGSPDAPLDSVQDGIDQAVADGKSYVLVAEGIYEESVALEEGLMVYGGWNSTFDEIDPSTYLSIIEATGFTSTSPAAVSAENITASTVFQGFWVYAWAGSADGSSAIGMWIEDCSDALVIADNVIEAGEGRAGADGLDGEDGDNGGNGINGEEGELSDCTALTTGGAGGSNSCGGTAVDGGDGGDAYCPTGSEVYQGSGYAGAPSGSGGGGGAAGCDGIIYYWNCGLCDISDCWDGGFDGGDGLDGGEGSSGAGASDPDGAVAAGFWFGETGTIGGDGEWGTGGGGGGAGSGAYVYSSCGDYHLGGTGGGGGAGGCAGLAGAGGGAGGASIGVLLRYTGVVSTLPVFSGNSISAAFGGHGGDGGNGGPGGVGGVGGFGGDAERTTAWCGLEGGDGGIGGDGGGGGGGGGGAGGPSYAAMAFGITPDAAYLSADNSMSYAYAGSAGRGGLGGNDPSSNGDNGVAGGEGEQNW